MLNTTPTDPLPPLLSTINLLTARPSHQCVVTEGGQLESVCISIRFCLPRALLPSPRRAARFPELPPSRGDCGRLFSGQSLAPSLAGGAASEAQPAEVRIWAADHSHAVDANALVQSSTTFLHD
jgi:hypothetical protein